MDAVRRDPVDRAAFERERATDGEKILDSLRHFIAAMGQEPVITHAYAEAARDPVENGGEKDRLPAPEEQ
jgi:hypothetical protein